MKGLDKLTCIRLAEVLSQRGTVTTDAITDALYQQDKSGEGFIEVLINGGHITEWDLAKVVVENFQLPFVMASNYHINKDALKKLPEDVLFRNLLVPLDCFGDVMVLTMPILTPYEVFDKLQKKFKLDFFPYVGLISENKRVLAETYPTFNEWVKKQDAEKEKRAEQHRKDQQTRAAGDASWMNIFDSGDAAVRDQGKKK